MFGAPIMLRPRYDEIQIKIRPTKDATFKRSETIVPYGRSTIADKTSLLVGLGGSSTPVPHSAIAEAVAIFEPRLTCVSH